MAFSSQQHSMHHQSNGGVRPENGGPANVQRQLSGKDASSGSGGGRVQANGASRTTSAGQTSAGKTHRGGSGHDDEEQGKLFVGGLRSVVIVTHQGSFFGKVFLVAMLTDRSGFSPPNG